MTVQMLGCGFNVVEVRGIEFLLYQLDRCNDCMNQYLLHPRLGTIRTRLYQGIMHFFRSELVGEQLVLPYIYLMLLFPLISLFVVGMLMLF